jgi:hypothetical protein
MLETSSRLKSNDEHVSLEIRNRPDAWLCELTLQETATEPASTTAVSAASPPRESASQAGPIPAAVADAVCGSQPSADFGPTFAVAVPVEAPRRLHVRASDQGFLPIQVEHYLMLLFTRRAWPPRALHSRPGAVLTGRTVQLLVFSDHTRDTRSRIVSGPRARMPWTIAPTDEFMGD